MARVSGQPPSIGMRLDTAISSALDVNVAVTPPFSKIS